MPTLDEKITVLEENLTMLLGIASRQERTINGIQIEAMSIARRLDTFNGNLYTMDHRLNMLEKGVEALDTRADEHTTQLDRIEAMLAQILARLPEQP